MFHFAAQIAFLSPARHLRVNPSLLCHLSPKTFLLKLGHDLCYSRTTLHTNDMDCSPQGKQGAIGLSGILAGIDALRRAPEAIVARLPMNNFIETLLKHVPRCAKYSGGVLRTLKKHPTNMPNLRHFPRAGHRSAKLCGGVLRFYGPDSHFVQFRIRCAKLVGGGSFEHLIK
jgi:hypothetical protein